jgi:hypothetical protein
MVLDIVGRVIGRHLDELAVTGVVQHLKVPLPGSVVCQARRGKVAG